MASPLDRIEARNIERNKNNGTNSTSLGIERYQKDYASIHDEYASITSEVTSLSTDVKAKMEEETKKTEKELQKKLNRAAVYSFIGQLPQIATSITSLIQTAKSMKAGDTSGVQNLEQKLAQAKQQSTTYANTLNEANSQKPVYEQMVKDQEQERIKQQGLYDKYKQEEDDLQASLDNGTDAELKSAKDALTKAEAMKTTKTVRDPQTGATKQVEDANLKAQKEKAIKDANEKIEKRTNELKEAIAKAKANKEAAQKANATAIEARDEAQAKVDELKKQINEITPKKTKLDNEINQLTAEIQRIKGGSTTSTTQTTQATRTTGGSEPSTK